LRILEDARHSRALRDELHRRQRTGPGEWAVLLEGDEAQGGRKVRRREASRRRRLAADAEGTQRQDHGPRVRGRGLRPPRREDLLLKLQGPTAVRAGPRLQTPPDNSV